MQRERQSMGGKIEVPRRDREFEHELRERLKAGDVLPLLPRHGVYLSVLEGNGRKCQAAFLEVWKCLPLGVRRKTLGHWRAFREQGIPLGDSPCIELTNTWSGRRGQGRRGDMAVVTYHGHVLRFWAKRVDLLPTPLVRDLIAHELARVYQCACGVRPASGRARVPTYRDAQGGEYSAGDLEDWADGLVQDWGFSATPLDQWALEQGITKRVATNDLFTFLRRCQRYDETGRR